MNAATAHRSGRAAAESRRGDGSRLFRAVNNRIRELECDRTISEYDFVCECGDETCTTPMRMTAQEFEVIRAQPRQYAVLPDHQRPEDEVVVRRTDGYVVVVKRARLDDASR